MWMADLNTVLQLHLVQLNKETDGLCAWYVIYLPWVFSD